MRLGAFLALGMDCGIYDEGYLSMSNLKTIFAQCALDAGGGVFGNSSRAQRVESAIDGANYGQPPSYRSDFHASQTLHAFHDEQVASDEDAQDRSLDEAAFARALSRLAQLDPHRHSSSTTQNSLATALGAREVGADAIWRRFAFYQEQSRDGLPAAADLRSSYLEHNFVPWIIDDNCVRELLLREQTLRAIFDEYSQAAPRGYPTVSHSGNGGPSSAHGMQFRHFLAFAHDYRLCPELCPQIALWQHWLVSSQTQHKQFQLGKPDEAVAPSSGSEVARESTMSDGQAGDDGVWYSFTNFGVALVNLAQTSFPRGTIAQRLRMLLDVIKHGFQRQVRHPGVSGSRPVNNFGAREPSSTGNALKSSRGSHHMVLSTTDASQARRQRSLNIYKVLMHPDLVAFLNPRRFNSTNGGSVTGGDGRSRLRGIFQRFTDAFNGRRQHEGTYRSHSQRQVREQESMNAVAWMEFIEAAGLLGAGHNRVTRTDALGVFNITVAAAQAASAAATGVGDDSTSGTLPRGLTLQMFVEALTRVAMIACESSGDSTDEAGVSGIVDVMAKAVSAASRNID